MDPLAPRAATWETAWQASALAKVVTKETTTRACKLTALFRQINPNKQMNQ
jgi:hypothetical protein